MKKHKARLNPLGLPLDGRTPGKAGRPPPPAPPLPGSTKVVTVGAGLHTHIYNPNTRMVLCKSASGRAKEAQPLYLSQARNVTCYRCAKLATMNIEAGRKPHEGPSH